MAKVLDMPKLSPTMEEGVLQAWHKNEGDAVAIDDLLAEVETDKATMEFRAFDKGTLLKILVPAGTNVKLGQAVAILGAAGEDVSGLAGAPAASDTTDAKAEPARLSEVVASREKAMQSPSAASVPPARAAAGPEPVKAQRSKGSVLSRTERDDAVEAGRTSEATRGLASPYVRKVARERGIDLSSAKGSGEHGRILPADLDALSPSASGSAPSESQGSGERNDSASKALAPRTAVPAFGSLAAPAVHPLSPMRKTIARRLTQSKQTVPHFYLTIDIDASPLAELRESINKQLAEGVRKGAVGEEPAKISLNDLLIKGVAAALLRVPEANAQFTDAAILIHSRVDISVAVAVPDGLVTPVVRNADQKSVVAIAREVRDLAARARAKKLKPEEMSDGTFSISNLGMFGIDSFAAVINPPEGAILAVGQARDEAIVRNGVVVAGKKMTLTLSCDHRVIDGAVGAAFLAELRALLEHPMRILTG